MITKIISGGQTGADQAGLRAGRTLGIATGGHVPKGWRTEEGACPWLATFGCVESSSSDYAPRTIYNIRNADFTLWFGNPHSPGGRLTVGTCESDFRAHVKIPFPCDPATYDRLFVAFRRYWQSPIWAPCVINIAGNRESTNPGIGVWVEQFLLSVLAP